MRLRRALKSRSGGSTCQRVTLTPAALEFLELLQDLGHLDERLVEGVIEAVAAELGAGPGTAPGPELVVDYDDVRRRVASLLLEEQLRLPTSQQELLTKEWRMLFG